MEDQVVIGFEIFFFFPSEKMVGEGDIKVSHMHRYTKQVRM